MTKNDMKPQLQAAVSEWVERTCDDPNMLKRFGTAEMRLCLTYEGEDEGQFHFEGVIEEVRRIEISDETNPLQDT